MSSFLPLFLYINLIISSFHLLSLLFSIHTCSIYFISSAIISYFPFLVFFNFLSIQTFLPFHFGEVLIYQFEFRTDYLYSYHLLLIFSGSSIVYQLLFLIHLVFGRKLKIFRTIAGNRWIFSKI